MKRRDVFALGALPFSVGPLGRLAQAAPALPSALSPEIMKRRMAWWGDLKFGLFLHWGAYSQLGCIESWPLSWADRKWGNPGITTKDEMVAFRKKYFDLPKTFNPIYFDPQAWARLAKAAGMRYVMSTTKHHDGFAMYDTKLSDNRITHPRVPFSRDPRANVTKELFKAFRERDFGIGCYFSKPDWSSPYYWDPARWAEDRNPNYDTAAEPQRWAKFQSLVHGQIEELMSGYGSVDILWLDGGQVKPPTQDIKMDSLVAMARGHQPGLLVVNRASGGLYEDYVTPEQEVLKQAHVSEPWESCITMGDSWSFKPDDKYKSAQTLIHMLIDVVGKGGNLLLNIGPQPDGRLPEEAVRRLEDIAAWMAINGAAIHGTRPVAPFRTGNVAYTRNDRAVHALVLAEPAKKVLLPGFVPPAGSKVTLLGSAAQVKWRARGADTEVTMPDDVVVLPPSRHAHVFRFA